MGGLNQGKQLFFLTHLSSVALEHAHDSKRCHSKSAQGVTIEPHTGVAQHINKIASVENKPPKKHECVGYHQAQFVPAEKHADRHQQGKKKDLAQRNRQSFIGKKSTDRILKTRRHTNPSPNFDLSIKIVVILYICRLGQLPSKIQQLDKRFIG
jgi:hypothetical protein